MSLCKQRSIHKTMKNKLNFRNKKVIINYLRSNCDNDTVPVTLLNRNEYDCEIYESAANPALVDYSITESNKNSCTSDSNNEARDIPKHEIKDVSEGLIPALKRSCITTALKISSKSRKVLVGRRPSLVKSSSKHEKNINVSTSPSENITLHRKLGQQPTKSQENSDATELKNIILHEVTSPEDITNFPTSFNSTFKQNCPPPCHIQINSKKETRKQCENDSLELQESKLTLPKRLPDEQPKLKSCSSQSKTKVQIPEIIRSCDCQSPHVTGDKSYPSCIVANEVKTEDKTCQIRKNIKRIKRIAIVNTRINRSIQAMPPVLIQSNSGTNPPAPYDDVNTRPLYKNERNVTKQVQVSEPSCKKKCSCGKAKHKTKDKNRKEPREQKTQTRYIPCLAQEPKQETYITSSPPEEIMKNEYIPCLIPARALDTVRRQYPTMSLAKLNSKCMPYIIIGPPPGSRKADCQSNQSTESIKPDPYIILAPPPESRNNCPQPNQYIPYLIPNLLPQFTDTNSNKIKNETGEYTKTVNFKPIQLTDLGYNNNQRSSESFKNLKVFKPIHLPNDKIIIGYKPNRNPRKTVPTRSCQSQTPSAVINIGDNFKCILPNRPVEIKMPTCEPCRVRKGSKEKINTKQMLIIKKNKRTEPLNSSCGTNLTLSTENVFLRIPKAHKLITPSVQRCVIPTQLLDDIRIDYSTNESKYESYKKKRKTCCKSWQISSQCIENVDNTSSGKTRAGQKPCQSPSRCIVSVGTSFASCLMTTQFVKANNADKPIYIPTQFKKNATTECGHCIMTNVPVEINKTSFKTCDYLFNYTENGQDECASAMIPNLLKEKTKNAERLQNISKCAEGVGTECIPCFIQTPPKHKRHPTITQIPDHSMDNLRECGQVNTLATILTRSAKKVTQYKQAQISNNVIDEVTSDYIICKIPRSLACEHSQSKCKSCCAKDKAKTEVVEKSSQTSFKEEEPKYIPCLIPAKLLDQLKKCATNNQDDKCYPTDMLIKDRIKLQALPHKMAKPQKQTPNKTPQSQCIKKGTTDTQTDAHPVPQEPLTKHKKDAATDRQSPLQKTTERNIKITESTSSVTSNKTIEKIKTSLDIPVNGKEKVREKYEKYCQFKSNKQERNPKHTTYHTSPMIATDVENKNVFLIGAPSYLNSPKKEKNHKYASTWTESKDTENKTHGFSFNTNEKRNVTTNTVQPFYYHKKQRSNNRPDMIFKCKGQKHINESLSARFKTKKKTTVSGNKYFRSLSNYRRKFSAPLVIKTVSDLGIKTAPTEAKGTF